MTTIPARVARTLTARAAFLAATCTNLIGMADRAVQAGDVESARILLAELAPFAAERARFAAAGWGRVRAWFGGWRCDCTILADTRAEIPATCPTHGAHLLGPAELTELGPIRLPLGIMEAMK